jgi:hypothetical protein
MTSLSFQKLRSDPRYEKMAIDSRVNVCNPAHCIEKCVDHIGEVHSSSNGEVKILLGAFIHSIDHEDERRWHISETFVNEKFM